MVGVTQVRARINDEKLEEFLDDRENKSETVREALRYFRLQQEGVGDDRLTDEQTAAYQWLRERVGVDGRMPMEKVKPMLAQQVGLKKDVVSDFVLRPLDRFGYIDVEPGMHAVAVYVRAPLTDDTEAESASAVDAPEESGETMDALVEAGNEVAESAD